MDAMHIPCTEERIHEAEHVLSLYNTRINPRDSEITDTEIFNKMLGKWGADSRNVGQAIHVFFGFFQQRSKVYEDTVNVLKELQRHNIRTGILTDVPYGMSTPYVQRDTGPIRDYIDVLLSSVEVGYRKPRTEGFAQLARRLGTPADQMLYVGDEQKDVTGANQAGAVSVLINREQQAIDWGQQITVSSLSEILNYV
jgi:putative hydrolase of the HAD superfamily